MAAHDFSQVLGAIENISSRNLAATPIDLTVTGEVAKIENPGIGQYLIKYQSNTWYAFSLNPEIVYNLGEKVYILVPQGDFSSKKIIIGRSSAADNISYAEIQEMTNFFIPQGPNWLDSTFYGMDHENLGICAVPRADRGSIKNLEGANYTDYGFARWPYASTEENQALWPENKMTLPPKNHHYAEDRDPASYPTAKQLEFADRMIKEMNSTLTWVGVKAKFRTEFLADHTRGKYGVRIEYLVRNHHYEAPYRDAQGVMHPGRTDVPKYDIVAKEISFESFSGNPYCYYSDTEQVGYFEIPLNQIEGLYRVSLFQNSVDNGKSDEENRVTDMEVDCMPTYNEDGQLVYLPKDNVYNRNNIFATEIDIRYYIKKNLLDSKYLVWITAEKGRFLYDGDEKTQGVSEVTLTAHLFYGNKDILNENDYNVYWFRECPDYDITNTSQNGRDDNGNKWTQYGGFGWAPIVRPIEGFGADDAKGTYVEDWMPTFVDDDGTYAPPPKGHKTATHTLTWNTLTIPKDQVPWKWLYKCVVVQKRNRAITDDTGEVLESGVLDQNPFWTYVEPSGLDGFEVCRLGSKYDLWLSDVIVDGSYSFLEIREKASWDESYQPPRMNPDWFGNWWVETPGRAPYAFAQQPDPNNPDGFRQIQYDANIYEGQVDITPYVDSEWQKFIVGCYDPKMLKVDGVNGVAANFGKNRTMCVGVLRKKLVHGNGSGLHVRWDPNQHIFNYDANGQGKAFTSETDWTLRPTLVWDDGVFDKGPVKIYGPGGIDTEPLEKTASYEGDKIGQGYTPPNIPTMLHDIYIETAGQGKTPIIHFKINDRWSDCNTGTEADNHFYLTVETYTGQVYGPYAYEVLFNKDGGSGSNGTGWSVDISPCNPEPVGLDPATQLKKFSQKYNYAMPVVVEKSTHPTGWKQKTLDGAKLAAHPVYIRPFIHKGGEGQGMRPEGTDIAKENSLYTDFYQFPQQLGYWAEYFWDVRIKGAVKNSGYLYKSYLKLCDPQTHNPFEYDDWKKYYGTGPRGWAPHPDWPAIPGVCGYSHSADKNFGAVEIQWNERMDAPLIQDFADFVVTLEIVIYRDCFVKDEGIIQPHAAGRKLVTSIFAYYPLDIFFDEGFTYTPEGATKPEGFNPKYVSINWPRILEYSTVGQAPIYESSPYGLEFYYGPNAKNLSRHDYQWNKCVNLTPDIQDVFDSEGPQVEYFESAEGGKHILKTKRYGTIKKRSVPDSNGKIVEKQYWTIQTYSPKGALNPVDGMIGGLATSIDGTSVFGKKGRYYRAQVFTINRFGNQAVNAWDGQSITLDEEEGTILAPTVVAGYKSPVGNDFSGCVMGVDKQITKKWAETYGLADNPRNTWDDRQVNFSSHAATYEDQNKYMAGLYGYQKGVCSFGLMENGVAFFGRANGGAQIVLDGSNGVIRGGGNGFARTPSISDPMWNCMRLNLVDLTHDAHHTFVTAAEQLNAEANANNKYPYPATGVDIPTGHGEDGDNNKSTTLQLDYRSHFRNPQGGGYDANDKKREALPSWYRDSWRRATVKRNGNYPYYLQDDLTGEEYDMSTKKKWESLTEYDPTNPDMGYNSGELRINYWDGRLLEYAQGTNVDDSPEAQQRSTFSAGRASTTPAIEIGQHIDGLIPGILPWGSSQSIWQEFYIPGNRNFMVTYDGTLWAMNGVFMGNVIGSNFVGGRIQGSEIGIGGGINKDGYYWYQVKRLCDWPPLAAPAQERANSRDVNHGEIADDEPIPNFYVDRFGNMHCASARIYGGHIDIGSFHILGPSSEGINGEPLSWDDYGRLVQFGESDFIGVVHCYGNLGVGPNLARDAADNGGSNFGHFTQIRGQVAMGIAAPKNDPASVHESVSRALGMTMHSRPGAGTYGQRMSYRGSANAEVGVAQTLEQASFFGLDSAGELPKGDNKDFYSGHFWPMSFNYTTNAEIEEALQSANVVPAWFTTMNIFKALGGFTPAAVANQTDISGGSNYFRVSPFAVESRFNYIKQDWSDEDKCALPQKDTYVGYMGLTERSGDGQGGATAWSLGFQSFDGHPIINHSPSEMSMRSLGYFQICANYTKPGDPPVRGIGIGGNKKELYHATTGAGRPISYLQLGYYVGEEPTKQIEKGIISGYALNKGTVAFCVTEDKMDGDEGGAVIAQFDQKIVAALTLNGGQGDTCLPGTWLWNKLEDIHIICGNGTQDNSKEINEIWFSKNGAIRANAAKAWTWSVAGEGAHAIYGGRPAGAIGMDEDHSEYFHKNMVKICQAEEAGAPVPIGNAGFIVEKGKVMMGDGQGKIRGEGGHIYFEDAWANENNQHNIYARFA